MGGTPSAEPGAQTDRSRANRTGAAAAMRTLARLNAGMSRPNSGRSSSPAEGDPNEWPDYPVQCTASFLDGPARLGAPAGSLWAIDQASRRLDFLERQWRSSRDSDLSRLASTPGVAHRVSSDTVLLTTLASRGFIPAHGAFFVDAPHNLVGLVAERMPELDGLAKALAVDLVFSELTAGAGNVACVRVGSNLRWVGATPGPAIRTGAPSPAGGLVPLTGTGFGAYAVAEVTGPPDSGGHLFVVADQAWRAYLVASVALSLPGDRAQKLIINSGATAHGVTATGDQISVNQVGVNQVGVERTGAQQHAVA